MFEGSAAVFTVRDIAASMAHYRDVLGFEVAFEYGDPVYYVCLCRDEVNLHLSAQGTKRMPGQSGLCIFVKDVDAVYEELLKSGAKIVKPPQDYAYGMRDFDILDLDGNNITFGMASQRVADPA